MRTVRRLRRLTRRARARRLAKLSLRVRKESMRVNTEFAAIEHDPEGLPQGKKDRAAQPMDAQYWCVHR